MDIPTVTPRGAAMVTLVELLAREHQARSRVDKVGVEARDAAAKLQDARTALIELAQMRAPELAFVRPPCSRPPRPSRRRRRRPLQDFIAGTVVRADHLPPLPRGTGCRARRIGLVTCL